MDWSQLMNKKNILLLCGGGGSEHDISLMSADYIKEQCEKLNDYHLETLEITKNDFDNNQLILKVQKSHFVIPCIHGPPGENGEIQSLFQILNRPYLGSNAAASQRCFNKVTTKLWLNSKKIPNTPFDYLIDQKNENNVTKAFEKFKLWNGLFIKAATQGSSIGCYHIKDENKIAEALANAFKYSSYVLLEKPIKARELEIAVYQYQGNIFATSPGEILCPDGFYDYAEKYNSNAKTQTRTVAANIPNAIVRHLKQYAIEAFSMLKCKDLARVDFFYDEKEGISLNEINTFPGMTPISMFPKMMENTGLLFSDFLKDRINYHTKII